MGETQDCRHDRWVSLAVDLGWQMYELDRRAAKTADLKNPDHDLGRPAGLTTFAQLDHRHRFRSAAFAVEHAVSELSGVLPCSFTVDLTPLHAAVEQLTRRDDQAALALQLTVNQVNMELLTWLNALDTRACKAYRLGCMLAAAGYLDQREKDPLKESMFGTHRDINIRETLDELSGVLPPYMGGALRLSYDRWADTVQAIADDEQRRSLVEQRRAGNVPRRTRNRLSRGDESALLEIPDEATVRRCLANQLTNQGKIWRAMLTGRKEYSEFLDENDYIAAADVMLTTDRRIAFAMGRRLLWTMVVPVVALAAAVAVVSAVSTAGSAAIRTATAVGAFGIAIASIWRAVTGLTKEATVRINEPIYQRALTARIAERASAPLDRALDKALQAQRRATQDWSDAGGDGRRHLRNRMTLPTSKEQPPRMAGSESLRPVQPGSRDSL